MTEDMIRKKQEAIIKEILKMEGVKKPKPGHTPARMLTPIIRKKLVRKTPKESPPKDKNNELNITVERMTFHEMMTCCDVRE